MKNLFFIIFFCVIYMMQAQEEFNPHGKVSGEVFGDYYYKVGSAPDSLLDGPGEYQEKAKEANAFALRRFYLGYEYFFSDKFSGRLLLEGTEGEINFKGKRGVNVKYAYLRWNDIFPGSKLIIGGQAAPAFSTFADKVWGYRSVEKNILDFRGLGNSNDFGVSLSGKILSDGTLNYYLMVGNGKKQKPEDNKYKKVYASVTAKLLDKHLLLDAYFDWEPTDTTNLITIKGFVGYQTDMFTIAVEPFMQSISEIDIQVFGMTAFVKGVIIESKLNVFARMDLFNPNTEVSDAGYKETFAVAGIDYTPIKKVHIIPNVWINSYSAKSSAEVDRESDIVTRLTFRFKF